MTASTLDARLAAFEGRPVSLQRSAPPSLRVGLADLVTEFRFLRRDIAARDLPEAPGTPVPEPAAAGGSERHSQSSRQTGRFRRARPTPTTRRCARCERVLPLERFTQRSRNDTRLRPYCGTAEEPGCWQAYQAERYCAVGRVAVEVELVAGDPCIGSLCTCGQPLRAGERITADRLRHAGCLPAGIPVEAVA